MVQTGIKLNVNVKTVTGSVVNTTGEGYLTENDFIRGSGGSDVVDIINAGAGNDRVWAGVGNDVVDGGDGHDTLYGENGNDKLFGGAGNDRLSGGNDQDKLYGGSGNDSLSGDNGDDYIDGGADNDVIWGGAGEDELLGGAGNDMLNGGIGNDRLTGGDGADRFEYWIDNSQKLLNLGAMFGKDVITDFSSAEKDKIDLRTLFERMSVDSVKTVLAAANNLVNGDTYQIDVDGYKGSEKTSTVWEFWTLGKDKYQFTLTAEVFNNVKTAVIEIKNLANDKDTGMRITLEDVADITGDYFSSDSGIKIIHGDVHRDNSDDVISYSAKAGEIGGNAMKAYGFGGSDTITGGGLGDQLYGGDGVDYLYGGAGNDGISGGNHQDFIYGQEGNDWLNGDGGDDVIYGDDIPGQTSSVKGGNDTLFGGAGNDKLYGGDGNDNLYGGAGDDTFSGGNGYDTFNIEGRIVVNFEGGTAYFHVDSGHDTITDFAVGDKIRFTEYLPEWNQQSAALRQEFVSSWFSTHAKADGNDLVISGDNNGGAKGGDWSITIENGALIADPTVASNYFIY